ncbi:MAG: 3-deoxy-D-manno-octulosonic acid transferase [Candidatus Omnitrophica bacterium]|nr:3-deoxy-D-manno-octulosonic acid transferase [Candidatus Omnitrophota bacterium]
MFFNFLFFLYALIYLPYLLLTGRWYKDYGCRFGIFPTSLKERLKGGDSVVWIHAVSVGEIMAIVPLIAKIKAFSPKDTVVVTVTTKTGYALAQSKLSSSAVVIPSPLDFSWVTKSFVRLIHPKIYIAAETEIWPNLFNSLYQQHIPIVIINGRISDVSLGRYKMIQFLLKGILGKVSLFCMQGDLHARRIVELGAPADRVVTVGNIKFEDLSLTSQQVLDLSFLRNRLLWVAGSTHPGEEEIILNVYRRFKDDCSLVIAPRHVERSASIVKLVESQGLKAVRFSQVSSGVVSPNTVVVVDTIGQLRSLYAKASFVFVGKSLCVGGGHNIIEPAVYAKPIVIGPLMANFRDITALFKAQDAVLQVHDDGQLEGAVGRLINDEKLRLELGQKALEVVRANQGALDRTLKLIEKWL